MPQVLARAIRGRVRGRRKRRLAGDGEAPFSLETLKTLTYGEILTEIELKVGTRPKLPPDLVPGSWSEQALKVLAERYLLKDEKGVTIETPEQMCWRVAWEVASAEARWGKEKKEVLNLAKQFYHLLMTHEFLPNSPTLMNAGTGNKLQYSACFVLPVEDSIEGIFDAIKYQAIIHKSGGGTGFSFSRLRPAGSRVRASNGTASGPVSFMRIFDAATNEIKQGGKRRGANMGILRINHPDILEFIHCKEEGGITNFNISVAATDRFMEALKKNREYELVDPRTKKVVGKLSAKKVFDEICQAAWRTGDPGMIFIDRINRGPANPVPSLGPIESTNPCGEQPLYPFDACNLGSLFLTHFVKGEDGEKMVDWEKLKAVTRLAVRFLDDVIEVNPYPLTPIRQMVLAIRRIGLGVGGWADMLVELGIPYDSQEALNLAERVMKTIYGEALETTRELAAERGPFPLWRQSIYKNEPPRRNATVVTIAPTGTISIIANASSGIEPLFAIAYQHIVEDKHLKRRLSFVNPAFAAMAKKRNFWSAQLMGKVAKHGTVREVEAVPQDVRAIFGTAHEIDPSWHVRHQAAFQKYTENAVSKTINLRREASVKDVKRAYLLAWETGCNGITIFRDGSKGAQVLNLGVGESLGQDQKPGQKALQARPYKVTGTTYRIKTPVGTAYITVNDTPEGEPFEVFINIGKAGSDLQAMAEALGRTIAAALRFRDFLPPKERAKELIDQLAKIGGRQAAGFGPQKVRSLPDAVALALIDHLGLKTGNGNNHASTEEKQGVSETKVTSSEGNSQPTGDLPEGEVGVQNGPVAKTPPAFSENPASSADLCPDCGLGALVYEEGCAKCYSCGYSEC